LHYQIIKVINFEYALFLSVDFVMKNEELPTKGVLGLLEIEIEVSLN